MTIEIILDGITKAVTKQELFDLAAKGIVNPQTPINVNGKFATVEKVKGIVFPPEETRPDFIDEPNPFTKEVNPFTAPTTVMPRMATQESSFNRTVPLAEQVAYLGNESPITRRGALKGILGCAGAVFVISAGIGIAVTKFAGKKGVPVVRRLIQQQRQKRE